MDEDYRFRSWFVDDYGWARMCLPFAVLLLCSLPVLLTPGNLPLVLLYTLLPVYMIHQYEEHARGRFVDFFNSTIGKERDVLTRTSAFWINILGVWVLFAVSFYLARYVAIGFAFVPVYATIFNGFTHAMAGVVFRRYNPGLHTALALFFPWGIFLLVYFNTVVRSDLLFNGIGLLVGVSLHAIILVYAFRRRSRLESRSRRGAAASP